MEQSEQNPYAGLEKALADYAKGQVCIVGVANQTPPEDKILLGGACQFFYQDEHGNPNGDYTDVHDRVDVAYGSVLSFQSNRPNDCVKEVRVIVKLASELVPETTSIGAADHVDAQHCMQRKDWSVGPIKSVLREQLSNSAIKRMALTDIK